MLLFPALLRAQGEPAASDAPETPQNAGAGEWRGKGAIAIREVPVWGRRPMKSIGVEETKLDSAILKENIALSMADALTFNTPVFVKQYGRATLSTVSFRGTGPSHTQVTWNGMRINNPMLGMTDFSMIPSYFIDDASLLHGTSSVSETGGGLGGLVKLSTAPAAADGFGLQYIQGIGIVPYFRRIPAPDLGRRALAGIDPRRLLSPRPTTTSTATATRRRTSTTTSMNIVGSYYPTERNKSGAFDDVHVLQEVYYNTGKGDRFGLNAWYINSNRELPLLTTDYADDTQFENRQREHTLRSVLSWDHLPPELEGGGESRIRAFVDGLRLPARQGQRHPGGHDPFAEQDQHPLRAGRRGVFRRRQMVLHGRTVGTPALRTKAPTRTSSASRADKAVVGYDKGRIELDGIPVGQVAPHGAAGLVGRRARSDVRNLAVVAGHPGLLRRLPALEARQRRGEGLRLAQLPLPDAQRPLLPAGRQPRPEQRTGRRLRQPDCRSPWERRARTPLSGSRRRGSTQLHRRLDSVAA